jgi:hypothetical protein
LESDAPNFANKSFRVADELVWPLLRLGSIFGPQGKGKEMDGQKNATWTDFDLLNGMKPLSFLSPAALHELASGLASVNWQRRRP